MRGLRRWPGYAALNRPLTVLGVERRLFLLGATLALAVWNATASLVSGGVIFAGCYGAGWLAGRKRPGHACGAPRGGAPSGPVRSGQVGGRALAPEDPGGRRAVRIADELRAYEAAGSLAEELPYWGWLGDGRTCLTRSGELIAAGRLRPAAVDGRTPEQIDRVLGLWQRLLSGLSPGARLYFYLLRRPAAIARGGEDDDGSDVAAVSKRKRGAFLQGRVQRLEAYVAWSSGSGLRPVAKSTRPGPAARLTRLWKGRRKSAPTYLAAEIEAAAARFRAMVEAGRSLVAEHTPVEVLGAVDASRLLSELINRPGLPWDGATGRGMNWRLALSELEAERSHLRLDGEPVILYSLLSPPGQSHANLLRDLYCLDATLTVSLEWRPWTVEAARRRIRGAQRHYFSRRYSMAAHVQETQGTAAAMVDSAAAVESDRLGAALVELEADGVAYGEASLTVALHGDLDETERLDGDVRRLFAAHDAKAVREGYGQLPVWFSRLPAQPPKRQIRSVFVSAGLAACLAPVFGPPRGSARSGHLGRESLAVFETPWRTAYHYDLFRGDVGHTLILGATGSGKSFALNFLLVEALKYGPRVLILDLGGSYRWLTRFLGGSYLELTPGGEAESGLRLQPFALPAGTRTFQFLTGWVLRLLKLGGYEPGGADTSEIRERDRGPVRAGTRAAHAERAGRFASVRDVAGAQPLDGGRRLGPLLRQRARRSGGPRAGRLAGDRPGGRGRARGPVRGGARLPAGADAARDRGPGRDGAAQADGRGRGVALPGRPGRARLPGRGGQDVAEEERRARARDPVGRGRVGHGGRLGAAGVDPDQAVPGEPGVARGGRRPVPAELLGSRADPGADAEARTVPPPPGRGGGAPPRSRPRELLALHLLAARCRAARRGRRETRTRQGAGGPGGPPHAPFPTPKGHDPMRLPTIPVLLTLLAAALPAAAQQPKEDAAFLRVPAAQEGEDRIHTIRARVRHTTVIVLPAGERILDFVAGDSEYWHLTGAANVAYLKPLAEDAATNIALVCESGRIYSFLAAEHGEEPPHLVVRVEAGADAAGMSGSGAPAFVARSEVAAYREMAAEAARRPGPPARRRKRRSRRSAPPIPNGCGSSTGWTGTRTNGRSSSRRCGTTAGSPTCARAPRKRRRSTSFGTASRALVAFDLTEDGLYVARHVLGDGWLQIGDERLRWRFEPAEALR